MAFFYDKHKQCYTNKVITKTYSITALLVEIRGEDRYKAVHALYSLINGFNIKSITDLVMLVEPTGNISIELFELCHDGLRIAEHIEKKKATIPDELPTGAHDQI